MCHCARKSHDLSAAITVALLVFVVMPRVTRWAEPWLFE
jgi:antibiotic biosynthesis monooxygenase (ABM) superfamily enzyme